MESVRPGRCKAKPVRSGPTRRLPLRWAVILVAATGVGTAVGFAAGIVGGVTVGVAVTGLLHKILA
jgi:hypothetical protein